MQQLPVDSKHEPLFSTVGLAFMLDSFFRMCFQLLFFVCLFVCLFASLNCRIRRTPYDLYFPYFSPKVVVRVNEKGEGTLPDAYKRHIHRIESNPGHT